jgi:hypothetical protein
MKLAIPHEELAEFSEETEPCRHQVLTMLRVMERLLAVNKGIGAAIERQAQTLGFSPKTLRAYYDDFRHTRDWRVLVNRQLFPERDKTQGAITGELRDLWHRLWEKNQRKGKPAYRQFQRLFISGQHGLARFPEIDPATMLPRGCTYRNLLRHRPDNFSTTAMREGLGAAMSKHGPMVLTTRVGLWVGSHMMIDDVKRDIKVLLLGQRGQTALIQELGVLDVFSGDRFAVHRRPMFLREDGVRDSVKEREMRWLIASVFRHTGWSRRGTEIPAEKGTAAIRKPLAKWLYENSGEKITVREPGMLGKEQVIAGYWGSGGGNPRHKAALESHHNLMQNEAGDLPAQVGHDRNPPEWLHGIEAVTNQVLEWICTLPPARAALFSVPMLEYWQALDLLTEIDERIAWRTDHKLEGWAKCGHTMVEFCRDLLADKWVTQEEFCTLSEREQQLLCSAAEAHPAFRRARALAPREVFQRGLAEFDRLSDPQLAMLFCDRNLGDDLRLPRTKRLTAHGTFELESNDAEPDAMFFRREVTTPDGGTRWLEERTEYTVAFNPFDRDSLFVYGQGADFIGTAPRIVRENAITISSGKGRQLGQRSHEKAVMLGKLRDRHAGTTELIAAMQRDNEAVLAEARAEVVRERIEQDQEEEEEPAAVPRDLAKPRSALGAIARALREQSSADF